MSRVIKTWTPPREEGQPSPPREVVGESTDDVAEARFVAVYGAGAVKDARESFAEHGGLEWPVRDMAGKFLGWEGYWYPEALPNYEKGKGNATHAA